MVRNGSGLVVGVVDARKSKQRSWLVNCTLGMSGHDQHRRHSARLLELIYAVTMGGRVLVPINFRLQHEEVDYIVEHSGAEVLLVDPELDEDLATLRGEASLRPRPRIRPGSGA